MRATGEAGRVVRVARRVLWAVAPAELTVLTLLAAGVRLPSAAVLAVELLLVAGLLFEVGVLARLYVAQRRAGAGRWAAVRGAVHTLVPVQVRRLLRHEVLALHGLGLWVLRRRHGVGAGDRAAGYTGPQTPMLFGFAFVAVVETVVLAFLIPWPFVHAIVLCLDVYTVVQILAFHAACVTRPHVAGSDGSLRVRYGVLLDVRIPAENIRHARVERRYPTDSKHVSLEEDTLDVVVGGQTTVCVELAEPVAFVRPLGKRAHARVLRFNVDEPRELVAALAPPQGATPVRTAPSPTPGRPV